MGGLVFIIDDDPEVRESVVTTVLSGGYEVKEFSSIQSAKEEFNNDRPSVVILDLMLDGENGVDFLTQAVNDNRDVS